MYAIIFDGRFYIVEATDQDQINNYDFFFTNFTDVMNVCFKANAILGIRGIDKAFEYLNVFSEINTNNN